MKLGRDTLKKIILEEYRKLKEERSEAQAEVLGILNKEDPKEEPIEESCEGEEKEEDEDDEDEEKEEKDEKEGA